MNTPPNLLNELYIKSKQQSRFSTIHGVPQPMQMFSRTIEEHVPLVVRGMRNADALILIARPYLNDPLVAEAVEQLNDAMCETASYAIYLDAKAGIHEEVKLRSLAGAQFAARTICVTAEDGIFSRELVRKLYEQEDPNAHIWPALQSALQALNELNDDAYTDMMLTRLSGIEDDNDVSIALSSIAETLATDAAKLEDYAYTNYANTAFKVYQASDAAIKAVPTLNSPDEFVAAVTDQIKQQEKYAPNFR